MTDSPLGPDRRLGEPLTQTGGTGEREIPGAGSPEARRTGPGAELSSVFADRLEWSEDLKFADGEANVVGSAELALNRRGSFHFAGKLENQGFPGEYAVVWGVKSAGGDVYTFAVSTNLGVGSTPWDSRSGGWEQAHKGPEFAAAFAALVDERDPAQHVEVRPGTAKELVPEVASTLGCTGRVVEVVGHYEDAARREQGKLGRVGRPEGPGDRP